jgi:hypothetical protein
MVIRLSPISASVLLFLAGAIQLAADITPVVPVNYVSAGRTIQPVRDTSVRMVSEKVDIAIKDTVAYVSCRFELRNEGKPKRLRVGFPERIEPCVAFNQYLGHLCGFLARGL